MQTRENRPWHPFRLPGLCGLRGTTCVFLTLSLIVVIIVSSSTALYESYRGLKGGNQTNNSGLKRLTRALTQDDSVAGEDNLWYKAIHLFTRRVGVNESCYVCAQWPHSAGYTVPVMPRPLNASEMMGVLMAFTFTNTTDVTDTNKSKNMTHMKVCNLAQPLKLLNASVADCSGREIRGMNMSGWDPMVFNPLFEVNPTWLSAGGVLFSETMQEIHLLSGASPL